MDLSSLLEKFGPTYFPWVVLFCAAFENDVTFVMAGVYVATVRTPAFTLPPICSWDSPRA